MFESAMEIPDHVGTIFSHMRYGKGLKKPRNKGKNPYYILYHHDDVVGCDAGSVPMELGRTTLKYWTCGGLHYYCQCSLHTGSSGMHQEKKYINQTTLKGYLAAF